MPTYTLSSVPQRGLSYLRHSQTFIHHGYEIDCDSMRTSQVQGQGSDAQPASSIEGQVTLELIQRMKQSITDALEAQQVDVADINGDGRHVGIDVVAEAFEVGCMTSQNPT